MKTMGTIGLLLMALAAAGESPPAPAADGLSLEQAVQLALQNDNAHRLRRLEVEQYRYRKWQNFSFLPQVTLDGLKTLKEKLQSIEMPPFFPGQETQVVTLDFTKNYEFTLQVVQPVFTGGKLWLAWKNAELDLRQARERERDSADATILAVRKTYCNILVLTELIRVHSEALELAEAGRRTVAQNHELGLASRYDLLRAETALNAARPDLTRSRNLLRSAWDALRVLIGRPEPQPLVLTDTLEFRPFPLDLDTARRRALHRRSELVQLRLEKRKTDNLLRLGWAQYVPDFSIVARYNFRSDVFRFRPHTWESYYSIYLSMHFPIFTGLRRGAQIGEIRVAQRMLEVNRRLLQDATVIQVDAAYRTLAEEMENIEAGRKNVETATEEVRVAELNHREGLITILELNSSHNSLTRCKVHYLQALYNYHVAAAELERLCGGAEEEERP